MQTVCWVPVSTESGATWRDKTAGDKPEDSPATFLIRLVPNATPGAVLSGLLRSFFCLQFRKRNLNQKRNIMKKLELTGQKFGSLKVLGPGTSPDGSPFSHWRCKCDCGNEVVVRGTCLKHGNSTSCGCSRQVDGFNARTMLTYKGKKQSLSAWAREMKMSRSVLSVRLHRKWSVEKALTTPVRPRKS